MSGRLCVECAGDYDRDESFYPDICDSCAAEQEGVNDISELQE
jgi:hypothetical protein